MKEIKKNEMTVLAAGCECKPSLVSVLRQLGYGELVEAGDGVSAWNYLKKATPTVVFSDWQLGQFDGLVLLKIMRADEKLVNVPIVLLASRINREMVIDAGHAGVSGILVAPFTRETVEEKIRTMFEILHDTEVDMKAEENLAAGEQYMQEGNYDRALEVFSSVLTLYKNPEVYYNVGYIKAAQKKYDESINAFRRAITIDQKYAKAYKALGEVYLKVGDKEKAEEMMQRAGEIYMEKDMSQEAEIAFQEVLKLNPNTTNIYNSLGILYRRNGEFTKSMSAYEKALRVDPEDENIFFNLGRACFDMGLLKRAKLYFQRALEICPEFDEAAVMMKRVEKHIEQQ